MNIRRFFIRAIKLNFGLNGWEQGEDGGLPEGFNEGFLLNVFGAYIICVVLNQTSATAFLWTVIGGGYAFFFGFFVFPTIRWALGIEFPSGDRFFWYRPSTSCPIESLFEIGQEAEERDHEG